MKVVNPFEGQPMKMCARCGGLIQRDAPREYIDNRVFHVMCKAVQEHEEKLKALAKNL
jgi:hypothetical protein